MNQRLLVALSLWACLVSGMAAAQTNSAEVANQINQGLADVKQARYESAVEHFRQANKLDPQSRQAAIYLAGALVLNYVPGVDTPDNTRLASEAMDVYKHLLALNEKNVTALKGIASLEFNLKKFEEAKSHYHQASEVDSKDPETVYAIGIIDWVEAYRRRAEERLRARLTMKGPPSITQPFCGKLRANNLPLVEDGIQAMKMAVELRPDYDDAMAYLSLLYRERADIQCNDKAARVSDERQAAQWSDKGLDTRKRRAETANDSLAQSTQSPESLLMQPLPPPPPPPPPPPSPPNRAGGVVGGIPMSRKP